MRLNAAAARACGLVLCAAVNALATGAPCPVEVDIPADLGFEAMLGTSVAMDGDLLAVGAPLETGVAWATGAAYVYRLESGRWVHEARLIAEDAGWGDMLGVDVDLRGDTLIAGAWFNDAFGSNSGAAYVFTRDATGTWSMPQKLVPPDGAPEDAFGRTVALGDGFCAIGAPLDDDQGASSGSIHVFDQAADGGWTHAAKLTQPATAEGHQLGLGLAADGLRIVGGAPWAHEGRGEIVFWERLGGTWLYRWNASMASVGEPEDFFGFSVSLDGDRMAVGCYRDDTYGVDAGSMWIFEAVFDGWAFWQYPPPAPQAGAQFGVSVAMSGDRALVGSRYALVDGVDGGRVDVFARSGEAGEVWAAAEVLHPPTPATEAEFGWALDIQGDHAVVGALYEPDNGAVHAWRGLLASCACTGDLDGDGDVGINDLLTVLEGWGGDGSQGDVNGDGQTGVDDLLALIAVWGSCDP
jgi:hypothetical protein